MPNPSRVQRIVWSSICSCAGFRSRVCCGWWPISGSRTRSPRAAISVNDLAVACFRSAEPLIRVLRALASFQIFRVSADGTVAHTPRSRLLRTDTPNSMHHAARFWTGPGSWKAWGMLDVAMTGGTPHQAAWNTDRFTYLRQHPDEARAFDAMMANFPDNRHAAIAGHTIFRRLA